MLVEMAVADAYGIGFEFVPNSTDRPNTLTQYYQHPTYGDMVPGCYTDDTQRSIANAMVVLGARDSRFEYGVPRDYLFNPLFYLSTYQQVFAADPRPGYSRRFEAFLKENLKTDAFDMALKLNRKPTNGAVMGAAVLGYLHQPEEIMLAAASQALSTHSYATIPYAQIVALSAHYFIYRLGKKSGLATWLYKMLSESGKQIEEFLADAALGQMFTGEVKMGASSAVKLMLDILPRNDSLATLTKTAVEYGGDTDSSAAICVAIASESLEYVNDLPQPLLDGLENGTYGRPYLERLDEQLAAFAQANRRYALPTGITDGVSFIDEGHDGEPGSETTA